VAGTCATRLQHRIRTGSSNADVTGPQAGQCAHFTPEQGQVMRKTCDSDLIRLRTGADGFATFIDTEASHSVTRIAAHRDACSETQA